MQYSHSRVSTHEHCPRQFKYRYIDKLRTVHAPEADNALIIGNSLHTGAEKGQRVMLDWYFDQFYVIDDNQVNESMKLSVVLSKLQQFLATLDGPFQHEYLIDQPGFKGFVDLIVGDSIVDLYDYKYSNNVDNYLKSEQLHLYKYYLEKEGFTVNRIGYVFVPKVTTSGKYAKVKQRKGEDLHHFRKRFIEVVQQSEIRVEYVEYDFSKVEHFWQSIGHIEATTHYPKNPTFLCDWCDYKLSCLEGIDYMLLPVNERREVSVNTTPDMWLYGDSYAGKTVFMDSFDDTLMINTDGNVDHISSPVLRIKDEVIVSGRLTTRRFAWDIFKEAVSELEKKQNDFKRVVLDLTEDLFEHCRLFMYDKLNVEHEHDAGFGKGYDMVRTEFLSTIKRLKNAGYQVAYLSKVNVSEVKMKNGTTITTYKPNINDRIANVLAGTVDITARVVADGDERYLSFKTSPYIFGGSRFNFGTDQIPLDHDAFIAVLENAKPKGVKTETPKSRRSTKKEDPVKDETPQNTVPDADPSAESETPKRSRRSKSDDPAPTDNATPPEIENADPPMEDAAPRTRRSSTPTNEPAAPTRTRRSRS